MTEAEADTSSWEQVRERDIYRHGHEKARESQSS